MSAHVGIGFIECLQLAVTFDAVPGMPKPAIDSAYVGVATRYMVPWQLT